MATEREREAFVQAALVTYGKRVSRRLVLFVYVLPIAGLALYVLVTSVL